MSTKTGEEQSKIARYPRFGTVVPSFDDKKLPDIIHIHPEQLSFREWVFVGLHKDSKRMEQGAIVRTQHLDQSLEQVLQQHRESDLHCKTAFEFGKWYEIECMNTFTAA